MKLEQGQDDRVNRPLLNTRASITLEVNQDMRIDVVQQAINTVDGLHFQDFYENGATNIVFESDRVNLAQIDNFISIYSSSTGQRLYDGRIAVTSTPVSTDKMTGKETFVRGRRFESAISMELPTSENYNKQKVENAFTFTGTAEEFGTPSDIQLTNPTAMHLGSAMVVTPKFDKKFTISSSGTQMHSKAVRDLSIQKEDVVYTGSVQTTGALPLLD